MCRRKPSWIVIIAFIMLFLWSGAAWCQYVPKLQGRIRYLRSRILRCTTRRAIRTSQSKSIIRMVRGRFLSSSSPTVRWRRKDRYSALWSILGQLRICKHSSFSRRLGCRFRLSRQLARGDQRSSRHGRTARKTFLSLSIRWRMSKSLPRNSAANSISGISAWVDTRLALIRLV